jgi:polyribonucleotide 5'-hydroxyl-kinase
MKIFKVGGPAISLSCLPIGMKADDNLTKVIPITAIHQLKKNQLLSLSFCPVPEKQLAVETNIQGIICISEVDIDRGILTILSPQPKPLPSDYVFLTSEVQFIDSN